MKGADRFVTLWPGTDWSGPPGTEREEKNGIQRDHLQMLKYAFHAETDGVMGIANLGVGGLSLYYDTDESLEGKNAFVEKRSPDYARFRGRRDVTTS